MWIKLLALLLIFLILTPATAQDETPLPVLKAEDIFAEGLAIIEQLPSEPQLNSTHVPSQAADSPLWLIIEVEDELYRLVNNETGQQSDSFWLFPVRGNDANWLSNIRPVASPNGRYVAFHDYFPLDARSAFMYFFYLYDTQTNQMQSSPAIDLSQYIDLQWISDTTLIIYARPDITQAHPFRLYRFDTDGTFEKIADAPYSKFSYFDNPARVLWADAIDAENEAYMLQEYRFDTVQIQTLFPISCSYICHILWHNDKTTAVQRVSNIGMNTGCYMWIYDSQNGNLLFKDISECDLDEETNAVGVNHWIYCAGEVTVRSSCTLRLLDMKDFSTNDIIPVLSWHYEVSPQAKYIYLYTDRYNPETSRYSPCFEIYDVESEKLHSILKHENLSISEFLWLIDDSFIVSVSDEAGNDLGRWHIRIDALNEGQT